MEPKGLIFDVKRDCSEDGPGIRTTIFFKGCPLDCSWCQNPESKSRKLGLSFTERRCDTERCGLACTKVCSAGALREDQGKLVVDHNLCNRCDLCFTRCPTEAIEKSGYLITVEELYSRVMIDEPFFRWTGGGVTLSGGEATLQMEFIHYFLKNLKEAGIHTAMETCGQFPLSRFREMVLPYLDLIYFDMKFILDADSKLHTGIGNKRINANLQSLAADCSAILMPRIPLILDIIIISENLRGINEFFSEIGVDAGVLLPYNPLWENKPEKMGLPLTYSNEFMADEEVKKCHDEFAAGGTKSWTDHHANDIIKGLQEQKLNLAK